MVSHEELIYNFADIYLKTAVECTICKENYTMTDDRDFLDEYIKLFVSLLLVVDGDRTLKLADIQNTLKKRKEEKQEEFRAFMKQRVTELAVEKVSASQEVENDSSSYIEMISHYHSEIFGDNDEVSNEPAELLRHIRKKEENL